MNKSPAVFVRKLFLIKHSDSVGGGHYLGNYSIKQSSDSIACGPRVTLFKNLLVIFLYELLRIKN